VRVELGQNVQVELTLKRDDQIGQALGRHPLPGVEFGMLGGEVDIFIAAGEPHDEPFLLLATVAPAPYPTAKLDGHVVFQPGAAFTEYLGQAAIVGISMRRATKTSP